MCILWRVTHSQSHAVTCECVYKVLCTCDCVQVFADDDSVISAGNFHGEYPAKVTLQSNPPTHTHTHLLLLPCISITLTVTACPCTPHHTQYHCMHTSVCLSLTTYVNCTRANVCLRIHYVCVRESCSLVCVRLCLRASCTRLCQYG